MPETEAADERVPSTGDGPKRTGLFATAALAVVGIVGALGFAASRDTWERSGPPIRVASWAPYWQPDTALGSFQANSELFADVSLVAFSALDATTIETYDGLPDGTIDTYRTAARTAGTPLIATIFDDSPAGTMAAVFADPATRATHVQVVVDLVVKVASTVSTSTTRSLHSLTAVILGPPPGRTGSRSSPNCRVASTRSTSSSS